MMRKITLFLGLTLGVLGLFAADAPEARAQCTHLAVVGTCPIGIPIGSTSVSFNADGSINWSNGGISGPCCPAASGIDTANGLFSLGNEVGKGPGNGLFTTVDGPPGSGPSRWGDYAGFAPGPNSGNTDINGDGYDDFFAGAYGSNSYQGRVFAGGGGSPPANTRHTVAAGETLFRISLLYGVPIGDLAAANNIQSNGSLFVGQTLNIPQSDGTATVDTSNVGGGTPLANTSHTVAAGETLFRIALRYGVPMADIAAANNIQNTTAIFVGQTLNIPQSGGTETVDTSNADCGASNSCGGDFFTPPPLDFGDCSGNSCETTGPADTPAANDPQFGALADVRRLDWNEVTIPVPNTSPQPPVTSGPVPVSITVDNRFHQKEGATVVVLNAQGQPVASGTTAKQGDGRPKFEANLPPGTYTIVTGWTDEDGNAYGGQQTYTVTGGENKPNVGVLQGGYQNPPGQGTIPKPVVRAAVDAADLETVPIFADGFESGDTTSWSSTVP